MKKVEIKNMIETEVACMTSEAIIIGENIVNMGYNNIIIDFSNINHITSVFLKNLLVPLYDNKINYDIINFPDYINDMLDRLINQFNVLGTVNLNTMDRIDY